MRRNLLRLVSLLAVAVLVFAGCSSDDDPDSGSGSKSTTTSEGSEEANQQDIDRLTEAAGIDGKVNAEDEVSAKPKDGKLETELDNFYFGPAFIEAEAGSTITLTLHNEGDTDHTFTIDSAGIDQTVSPGEETNVEVQVPDTGSLNYYCRFHRGSGMQGALIVS
jgi:plastocyanin